METPILDVPTAIKMAAREPDSAVAQYRLGQALANAGRLQEAFFRFNRAATLNENYAAPLIEMGRFFASSGQLREAEAALRGALMRDPSASEAHHGLGAVLIAGERLEEAITQLSSVPQGHESYPEAQVKLGQTLFLLQRAEEALAVFSPLMDAYPDLIAAYLGAGSALRALGRSAEAQAVFEKALAMAPHIPTLHRAVAEGKKFKAGDPQISTMESLLSNAGTLPVGEGVALHFALAKAYDDIGEPDRAFELWREGNFVKRRLTQYDEAAVLGHMEAIQHAYNGPYIAAREGLGDPSETPVFIVGMPRSGTTLVEQILASHKDVAAMGEQRILSDLIAEGRLGQVYLQGFDELPPETWSALGAEYLARLPQGKKRVTDKLPANYRHIGLIHLALPGAKIIHVRRDAMDTCFSCYRSLFPNGLEYTSDLGELGRYYAAYERLMAHWRAVLPQGAMLEIDYEDLVADLEGGTRNILDYCGLDFDPACLDFHKTDRAVFTVSVEQVRSPLYKTAMGRWKAYEAYLEPLKKALQPSP
ncbi:tetratricopeptide (TPR) repeat protein [Rhizomicrobium palustre]|uniref:Tetratricopeptide (TPR) repeat protein n=1 Tax=Rhizomicrobium palustre TaxID=189966 RepID=A0A846N2J5_9PROT|nr:sulfotransferase [Rhizomicrobium palustre]NIK89729.1 tetratricopeptide (TPR) repeat protein [Rhizomicrobium palustre]